MDDDVDDLLFSREELVEYDDESLSCLLFVLDEILFTLLLLLLLLLELLSLLPSFSLSLDDEEDDEVRDVLLPPEAIKLDGATFKLLENGICMIELDDEDEFFELLDFFCLLLLEDERFVEASGSISGRLAREDE